MPSDSTDVPMPRELMPQELMLRQQGAHCHPGVGSSNLPETTAETPTPSNTRSLCDGRDL